MQSPPSRDDALLARMDVIERAVRDAAGAVWALRDRFTAHEKRPDDWVTDADRLSDQVIRAARDRYFPEDGWLSEESIAQAASGAFMWVVDPIDGTREFVEGSLEYVVSIGLVYDGEPVGGVLGHPPSGAVMTGSICKGLGPIPIRDLPETRASAIGLRILASRSDIRRRLLNDWPDELQVRSVGSIAYKLGLMAYGECDGVVSVTGKRPWDVAGGFGLLRAAGLSPLFVDGRVPVMTSSDLRLPPFVVAKDPTLANRLLEAVRRQIGSP